MWWVYFLSGNLSFKDVPTQGRWLVVIPDGSLLFVSDSQLHNEYGPAVIWPEGAKKQYYLKNVGGPLSKEEWLDEIYMEMKKELKYQLI